MSDRDAPHQKECRVFVGCATPNLRFARALHQYLDDIALVTVWDQGTIRPSQYAPAELIRQARQTDFGVFILGLDEERVIGKSPGYLPNQNVILEIGMFGAVVGFENVFVLVPKPQSDLQLPTDLSGYAVLHYNPFRSDENASASIALAADQLRKTIISAPKNSNRPVDLRPFVDWTTDFQREVEQSKMLAACFLHSRRWRENHGDAILRRSMSGNLTCRFYIPDLADPKFIKGLQTRFDDGPAIPTLIGDTVKWLIELMNAATSTEVFLFRRMPAYSWYRFDNAAFMAFYPNATTRKPSPTAQVLSGSHSFEFLKRDERDFAAECVRTSIRKLTREYRRFVADHAVVAERLASMP